jgi:hypothetical protein
MATPCSIPPRLSESPLPNAFPSARFLSFGLAVSNRPRLRFSSRAGLSLMGKEKLAGFRNIKNCAGSVSYRRSRWN